jgi:CHAT domain-containing protein
LWDLDDDAAAPLFLHFHKLLRGGMPPAQALRMAQIEMIRSSDPRLHHPAAWAPVEMTEHAFRKMAWF